MAADPSPVRPIVFTVAILLTILCGVWVRQAEIVVYSCQVTESVPAVPAVAVLLLLLAARPLLRYFRWSSKEVLIVYAFMVIAISVSGVGIVRFVFALVSVPIYFATPESNFALIHPHLRSWLVPMNAEVSRQLFEGSPRGEVPWREWMVPLVAWTVFFMLFWVTVCCLLFLFRRQWTDSERLSFPLLFLPMEMTGVDEVGESSVSRFFRNPVMWTGFALATLYNLLNMLHAFNPMVPNPGLHFDVGSLFTERPFDAMQPMYMLYRPDIIGFGFLVSTEVSFTIWITYFFQKALSVGGRAVGYEMSGYPFAQEQSIGAYICLALFLIWAARKDVMSAGGLHAAGSNRSAPTRSSRVAFAGLIIGTLLLCIFSHLAGMSVWSALLYLVIVFAVALVYARIRAETGVPLIWMFPYHMQKKVMLYTLGYAPFVAGGNLDTLTGFALLTFLSRGYFPNLAAYQLENFRLAEMTGIRLKHMSFVIILALLVGLGVAYYVHLTPYYYYGAGTLRGGMWGTDLAMQEYEDIIRFSKTPKPPEMERIAASAFGFLTAGGLALLRMTFLRFPLHPLGFAMATAFGDLIWYSALAVWIIKTIILRIGGVKLYKKLIPGFLGFALGHFFTAGMVWGLLSVSGLVKEDVFRRYGVSFG